MDSGPDLERLNGEEGFTSLQFVVAAALAMLMVVGLLQLVTYQYTKGAALAALERGVRAASISSSPLDHCHAAVADSVSEVLGGSVGGSLAYGCDADGSAVHAWATGTVPGWTTGMPDLGFRVETSARTEAQE